MLRSLLRPMPSSSSSMLLRTHVLGGRSLFRIPSPFLHDSSWLDKLQVRAMGNLSASSLVKLKQETVKDDNERYLRSFDLSSRFPEKTKDWPHNTNHALGYHALTNSLQVGEILMHKRTGPSLSHSVTSISIDDTLFSAAKLMTQNACSSILVHQDDLVVAMLTDKQLVAQSLNESSESSSLRIGDVISQTSDLPFATAYSTLEDCIEIFLNTGTEQIPVCLWRGGDKHKVHLKDIVGMVTLQDICRSMASLLGTKDADPRLAKSFVDQLPQVQQCSPVTFETVLSREHTARGTVRKLLEQGTDSILVSCDSGSYRTGITSGVCNYRNYVGKVLAVNPNWKTHCPMQVGKTADIPDCALTNWSIRTVLGIMANGGGSVTILAYEQGEETDLDSYVSIANVKAKDIFGFLKITHVSPSCHGLGELDAP